MIKRLLSIPFPRRIPPRWYATRPFHVNSVKLRQSKIMQGTIGKTRQGAMVFDIENPNSPLIGLKSVKGNRPYQEDASFLRIYTLQDSPNFPETVYYFAIFDGHGGGKAVEFCRNNHHEIFNTLTAKDALPTLLAYYKLLHEKDAEGDVKTKLEAEAKEFQDPLPLDKRLRLSFLMTDLQFCLANPTDKSGTTASIALMQYGYDTTNNVVVDLTVGSCGDCHILLCDSKDGSAIEMTRDHHGNVDEEAERIESFGGEILDAYGKLRVEGQLEPTRALGDATFKKYGVWAEPDITYLRDYPAGDLAFMVLVTDGIKQSMSDQEIVDVVKNCPTPLAAANKLVDMAETLNVDDNKTALIVRFDAWPLAAQGKIPDLTKAVRARRLAKYQHRKGSAPKELADDEDVDAEVFERSGMSRADTEEERRACLDEVFGVFREKKIDKPSLIHALRSLGIDLDDQQAPDYDEDEDGYENWIEDRSNPQIRAAKTVQVVDKLYTVKGGKETLDKQELMGGLQLVGVWIERHTSVSLPSRKF